MLLGNGTDVDQVRPRARSPATAGRRLGPSWASPPRHSWSSERWAGSSPRRDIASCSPRPEASGSSDPDARFLVLGEADPDKARRDDAGASSERAGNDVVFAGWREDVRDLLALMDVFVLASWREGIPRSAIEAAAMGTPLVLTDIRGCREVVRDGIEGLLVPPRDPAALTAAIERLLGDAGFAGEWGHAARPEPWSGSTSAGSRTTWPGRTGGCWPARGCRYPELERMGRSASGPPDRETRPRWRGSTVSLMPTAFLPSLGEGSCASSTGAHDGSEGRHAAWRRTARAWWGSRRAAVSVRGFYRRF